MATVYDTHKPKAEGEGLYLRIGDGETAKVRIVSEPVIYDNDFQGKISTRYAWLVWNFDRKAVNVLQQSATFYKSIANYAQDPEYGDPKEYDLKIVREGTGTDTTYHITPGRNSYKLDKEALEAAAKVNLLEAVSKGQGVSNVFWLKDFVEGKQNDASLDGYNLAKSVADKLRNKKDDTDLVDTDIDLSDIPF